MTACWPDCGGRQELAAMENELNGPNWVQTIPHFKLPDGILTWKSPCSGASSGHQGRAVARRAVPSKVPRIHRCGFQGFPFDVGSARKPDGRVWPTRDPPLVEFRTTLAQLDVLSTRSPALLGADPDAASGEGEQQLRCKPACDQPPGLHPGEGDTQEPREPTHLEDGLSLTAWSR